MQFVRVKSLFSRASVNLSHLRGLTTAVNENATTLSATISSIPQPASTPSTTATPLIQTTSAPVTSSTPSQKPGSYGSATIGDTLINAFVNNIMKDGKKATARRILQDALMYIQEESKENPRAVLAKAIDKVEPLMKLVGYKRGAKSVQTPHPLNERQRRRTAILWVKEAADDRPKRDSMGVRLGKEIMAIMKDESSVIQKRTQLHKAALQNRSNVVLVDRKVRKF
ncbi:hypothetical protein HDU76_011449 [Blyttiomyces sp. JEL0837]|nr:hypothetical protein HDU76_011449 [Blyttiomyces sp. JEL0837]